MRVRGEAGCADLGDAGGVEAPPGSDPGNHPAGETHQEAEADLGVQEVPSQGDQPECHRQRSWGEPAYGGEVL